MKRLFISFALIVVTSILTLAQAQNNLYWMVRFKVKLDKKLEWEKKFPVFLKTHYPHLKVNTYLILTGENAKSYVSGFGPMSYKDLDAPPVYPKGEALLKTDGQAIDALCETVHDYAVRRVEDISDMKPDRKVKYLLVTYYEINPGQWSQMHDLILIAKEGRKLAGSKMDYDYYRPSGSGNNNVFAIVRYMEKLEEMDFQEDWGLAYNAVHGAGAWERRVAEYYSLIKSSKSELRVLREDLSTK